MVCAFPGPYGDPERFGAPIRDRFSESDTMQPQEVQMPVPAPGRKVGPSPAEPIE
jgi:hypothetical protein